MKSIASTSSALLLCVWCACGPAQDHEFSDEGIEQSIRGSGSLTTPPPAQYPDRCRTAPTTIGRADVAEIWKDSGATASFRVRRSNGTDFDADEDWATQQGGFDVKHRWAVGDVNDDGQQDVIGVWNDNGQNTLTVRRSNGSSFPGTEHWAVQQGTWQDTTTWMPGDFNGDGLDDMAAVRVDGDRVSIDVYLSNGRSYLPRQQWVSREGGWHQYMQWDVGDFDGDGLDDILCGWNDQGMTTLTVRRSTGSTFVTQHWAIQETLWDDGNIIVAGDFNGDGWSDAARIWETADSRVAITVHPSDGTAFTNYSHWAIYDGNWLYSHHWAWSVGDFDADGLVDLFVAWNDDDWTTLTVRKSTGSEFLHQHWAVQRSPWDPISSFCTGTFDTF